MARKDGKPRSLPAGHVSMSMSGFCAFPSTRGDSHKYCRATYCVCNCHSKEDKK